MRTLTFSGILLDIGEMTLEPGFVVEGQPSRDGGEVTVEALASRGEVLAMTELPLSEPCGRPGELHHDERPPRVAVGLVAFPPAAVGLRVTFEGRTLLERFAPRAARRPTVEWPQDLGVGTASVQWRSGRDVSMASLGYSNDGGRTWSPLSLPTSSHTIEFDAGTLAGGAQCVLELAVTDGFRTTRVQSPTYSVEPKGWVLWILSPAPGAVVDPDGTVLLAAQGYHVEEHRPSFDEITWSSSRDGTVGHGAQLIATLSPGDHTITATMQDVSSDISLLVTP